MRNDDRLMNVTLRYCYLLILVYPFFQVEVAYGQWTRKDSVWLQNVLSGKDTLRLNPETMRAIQSGSFLTPEPPVSPMLSAPTALLILKDFSEYIDVEEGQKMALKDLPPGVFWLTGRDLPLPYKVNHATYRIAPGSLVRGSGVSFSHVLSMAFSPYYRQMEHNRKHAVAYKTYEKNLPTKSYTGTTYRTANPEQVLPLVKARARKDSTRLPADSILLAAKDSTGLVGEDSLLLDLSATSRSFSVPDSAFSAVPEDSLWYRMPRH